MAVGHLAQRRHGVTHKRDKMIRAMSQCSVIEGAVLLLDAHRFGAHLQNQGLSDGQTHLVCGRDTEAAIADPVRVLFRPDERHGRMQRQWEGSDVGERIEHAYTVCARGVGDDGSRPHRSRLRQIGDDRRQSIVGDRDDKKLAV